MFVCWIIFDGIINRIVRDKLYHGLDGMKDWIYDRIMDRIVGVKLCHKIIDGINGWIETVMYFYILVRIK